MGDKTGKTGFNGRQFALWIAALVLGGVLGTLGCGWLNEFSISSPPLTPGCSNLSRCPR